MYLSRYRVSVWRLCGDSTENHNLTVIYAGLEINKEYLKNVIFGSACKEEPLGRIWKYQLKRIAGPKTSVLVSEYDTERRSVDQLKDGFIIPFWLGWVADISEDTQKIIKSNSSLVSDLRRIRKNNLDYQIIDSPAEYEAFYNTMYLPYIQKNYKNTALLMNHGEMLSKRDDCQLLYVKKGQEHIGGILIKYESEHPRLWSIGVKQANEKYLHDGVVGALYYFPIKHLKENGYDRVHFGGTRSFLNDGVLNYKKKWPIQNDGFTKQGFHVQLLSKTPDTIKLLKSCPFIYIENGKLNSAVFIGPDDVLSPKDFKKLYKSYFLNGLDKIVLYVFGQKTTAIEHEIPPDEKDNFVVRSAENIFTFYLPG